MELAFKRSKTVKLKMLLFVKIVKTDLSLINKYASKKFKIVKVNKETHALLAKKIFY